MPYRRFVTLCLVGAPALFLVANVFHPKEYKRGHEVQQLAKIADSYTRWQVVHFLTFIAIAGFLFAILGLAWLLVRRRPRQGALGGALALFGLVSTSAVLALEGFTWGILGEVSSFPSADKHTMVLALHGVQWANWNLPFYVGSVALLIGLVILAAGLIGERVIPALWGWVFAAGVVLVGLEVVIESNVYFVIAAAVLAIGAAGVGVAVGRVGDEELAV